MMICDHGVIRYKPIDFGYANFKHEHFEAGVSYFRDYHYEIHKGFTFVEYKFKYNGREYENHIYVSNTNLNHLNDLFDHWTRNGWTYEIVKIHNDVFDEINKGFTRVEYKSKYENGNEYENDIYVSNNDLNRLNDLFDHWTRNGGCYEIVKIHNDNSTPTKMSVNLIHKDKWNLGNLPKNGKWFFGLKDKGMVPNVLRWHNRHNKKWLYSTGEIVDEEFGPKYWLPIPNDPE